MTRAAIIAALLLALAGCGADYHIDVIMPMPTMLPTAVPTPTAVPARAE